MEKAATAILRSGEYNFNDAYIRISLAIVGAHLMTNYDEQESLLEAIFSVSYWRAFIASFCIASVIAFYIHKASIWLDERYHWLDNLFNRFCWQAILGVIVPALATLVLISIYFAAFGINILETEYLKEDYIIAVLMIICLNLYCFSIRQFVIIKSLTTNVKGKDCDQEDTYNIKQVDTVPVRDGKEIRLLTDTEIAAIFIVEGNTLASTFNGRDFITDLKLDFLESVLDAQLFYRVNRQLLANRSACMGYTDAEYGKLRVTLYSECPVETVVSQRKASNFKKWFDEYCLTHC